MRQYSYLWITGAAAALFLAVLVLAGCGGGGPTGTVPAVVPAALQFKQLLPKAQQTATRVGASVCANCHAANYTPWAKTQHAKALVDCESCHGPGSVHVAQAQAAASAAPSLKGRSAGLTAAQAATTILTGAPVTRSVVCGQCHSQEFSDFAASPHAQVVTSVVTPTTTSGTTCFRCHSGSFRALYVDEGLVADEVAGTSPIGTLTTESASQAAIDANIASLTTAQVQAFGTTATTATAAGSSAATIESPTCSNCHDPHNNTAFTTSANEQDYLRRKTANTDTTQVGPGAAVGTYTTTVQICGACHNTRGGNPADSALASSSGVSRAPFHEGPEYNMLNGIAGAEGSSGGPPNGVRTTTHQLAPDQCATCHMPNARHTFTVSLDTSCSPCHTPSDAASRLTALQGTVQQNLLGLETLMQQWANKKFPSSTNAYSSWWDYTGSAASVGGVKPTSAQEAAYPIQVLEARANYYYVILDRSYGVHNYIYTNWLLSYSTQQMTSLLQSLGVTPAAVPKGLTRQQRLSVLNAALLRARTAEVSGH